MSALWFAIGLVMVGCAGSPTTNEVSAASSTPSISTDPTYGPGAPISATWSRLPGNAHDWVALAPANSAPSTVLQWTYTNGALDGAHAFGGLVPGDYVARAFVDDSYTVLAEAPFAVTGVSVARDHAAYVANTPITITWSGLPGTATDWVGLAPEGAPATTVSAWAYTGGLAAGTRTFSLGTAGRYVARAFPSDSYTIAGESSAFTNGLAIATDHASYDLDDWIALAPQGSPPTTVTTWVYTNGASAGSHTFAALAAGTYVARALVDDSYDVLVESAPFVVGGDPLPTSTVAIALAPIGWGQRVTVTWSGFPTNAQDWVALAPAGSPVSSVTRWVYTGGATSGTHAFSDGIPTVGNYVVRGFVNDTSSMIAESAPFVVQDSCVPLGPNSSDEDFTGIGNHQPAGSDGNNGNPVVKPCLEEASSLEVIGGPLFSAPRLRLVTGPVTVRDVAVLALPRLAMIGGKLDLRGGTFVFPSLATLGGSVDAFVDALDLGLATTVAGDFQVVLRHPSMAGTIVAHELSHVMGKATLIAKALELPKLQRIDGDATIRAEEIVLPALEYMYSFYVVGTNNVLPLVHKLLLPSIQRVENTFLVQSNPELPQCEVDAVVAQLSPPPFTVSNGSNHGVCSP
jgi:hypothetical protein